MPSSLRLAAKHVVLQEIQQRTLDQFYNVEEDLLVGKGDFAAVEKLLQVRAASCPKLLEAQP